MDSLVTFITTNAGKLGRAKRIVRNGKAWWVAPATSLPGDGVLSGSKGVLHYPAKHVEASTPHWDGKPITLNHPSDQFTGARLAAKHRPDLHLGFVSDSVIRNGKLRHQLWFNEQRTAALAPQVLANLKRGQPIELSTGLFTDNEESPGVNGQGRPYTHVARNYRPDHIAVLEHETGACSINDGCGVGVVNERAVVAPTDPQCPT